MNPFSGVITRDDLAVIFTARDGLWAVTLPDGVETLLASFGGGRALFPALSPDGREVAVGVGLKGGNRLVTVDLFTGAVKTLLDAGVQTPATPSAGGPVGRAAFSPSGAFLLYSGGPEGRLRLVQRDGGGDRLLYRQGEGEWVLNGFWLGDAEVAFLKYRDGLYRIGIEGEPRVMFKGPVWHAAVGRDGKIVVCDTRSPDIGLVLIATATGMWRTLCYPHSSGKGFRWLEPVPLADEEAEDALIPAGVAPADVRETAFGPGWTHSHPSFHPDRHRVFFTSDVTGTPQVYLAAIPDSWFQEMGV